MPGGKTRNSYSPPWPVVVSRCTAWAAFAKLTFALPIAAPDLSVIVPRNDVVPVCAQAHAVAKTRTIKPTRKLRFIECEYIPSPFAHHKLKIEPNSKGRCRTNEERRRLAAGSRPSRDNVTEPRATSPTARHELPLS